MKRTISIIVAACLICAFGLTTACSSSSTETTTAAETTAAEATTAAAEETTQAAVTGGYTLNTDMQACTIPEDAQTAFDNATKSMQYEYEAIALLATQVVSGTNYQFLAKVTNASNTYLAVITVYADLDGNCSVTDEDDVELADIADSEDEPEASEVLEGGWTINSDVAAGAKIDEDVQKAFDSAMEGLVGASYEPIVVLGSQVVSGTNYEVLCKETLADANGTEMLAVVILNVDLDGNSSILKIVEFDLDDDANVDTDSDDSDDMDADDVGEVDD